MTGSAQHPTPPGDDLFGAFHEGLPAEARARFAGCEAAAAARLTAHLAAARAAWTGFAISPPQFARELGRRLGDSADLDALARCHATDVYLAIAASQGDARAIRAIEQTCIERALRAATHKTSATTDQRSDVTQTLRRLLFVDEPSRAAACRNFNGGSTLVRYLTIIATRELVRLIHRARGHEPLDEQAMLHALTPASDPRLAMMRERYRDDVDASFRVALGKLSKRSVALLRLKLVRGWSMGQIAAFHRRSLATVHRWVAEARDELAGHIRAEVAQRLGIPTFEVDSVVRLVQSQIDLSLEDAGS